MMESRRKPESDETNDRGVSPVIGVILMVAITVILAAVIAAFVLDLGSSQSASPSAGVQFGTENSGDDLRVTVTSVDRADSIKVQCTDGTDTETFDTWSTSAAVGDTTTINLADAPGSGGCSGEEVQVIGTYEGQEALLTTYDDHI